MQNKPIVLISGFKAGTWLMRKTLSMMTNMEHFEPEIIPGEKKYYDASRLYLKEDTFYSWHNIPTDKIIHKLNTLNAKTIFVVRNIYDVVVSIYYHFYNDIDADSGRGNGKDRFLKQFSFDEGLTLIISGFDEGNGIRWNGMAEIVDHYNHIFKAIDKCDSIVLDFDEIVTNNTNELNKINDFLALNLTDKQIEEIENKTKFQKMKEEAKKKNIGVSHFREGKAKKNRKKLKPYHQVHLRQIIKQFAPDIFENAKKVQMKNILTY